MNIQEAIEQLKFDKELAKRDYISPTNHEEYDLAIEALEKQIPKKVGCKICNDTSNLRYYKNSSYRFCPHCGQKLDWSVEE